MFQRKVLIMVNKAYRTISHDANCVIAGIIPIDILLLKKCNIYDDICQGIAKTVAKVNRRKESLTTW